MCSVSPSASHCSHILAAFKKLKILIVYLSFFILTFSPGPDESITRPPDIIRMLDDLVSWLTATPTKANLQVSIDHYVTAEAQLRRHIKDLNLRFKDPESQISVLKDEVQNLKHAVAKEKSERARLTHELAAVQQDFGPDRSELVTQVKRCSLLARRNNTDAEKHHLTTKKVVSSAEEHRGHSNRYRKEVKRLNEQNAIIATRNRALEHQFRNVMLAKSATEQARYELGREIAACKASKFADEIRQLQDTISALRQERESREEVIRCKDLEISQLNVEVAQSKGIADSAQHQLACLNDENKVLKQKSGRSIGRVKSLRAALEQVNQDAWNETSMLESSYQSHCEAIENALGAAQLETTHGHAQNETMVARIAHLEKLNQDQASAIASHATELQRIQTIADEQYIRASELEAKLKRARKSSKSKAQELDAKLFENRTLREKLDKSEQKQQHILERSSHTCEKLYTPSLASKNDTSTQTADSFRADGVGLNDEAHTILTLRGEVNSLREAHKKEADALQDQLEKGKAAQGALLADFNKLQEESRLDREGFESNQAEMRRLFTQNEQIKKEMVAEYKFTCKSLNDEIASLKNQLDQHVNAAPASEQLAKELAARNRGDIAALEEALKQELAMLQDNHEIAIEQVHEECKRKIAEEREALQKKYQEDDVNMGGTLDDPEFRERHALLPVQVKLATAMKQKSELEDHVSTLQLRMNSIGSERDRLKKMAEALQANDFEERYRKEKLVREKVQGERNSLKEELKALKADIGKTSAQDAKTLSRSQAEDLLTWMADFEKKRESIDDGLRARYSIKQTIPGVVRDPKLSTTFAKIKGYLKMAMLADRRLAMMNILLWHLQMNFSIPAEAQASSIQREMSPWAKEVGFAFRTSRQDAEEPGMHAWIGQVGTWIELVLEKLDLAQPKPVTARLAEWDEELRGRLNPEQPSGSSKGTQAQNTDACNYRPTEFLDMFLNRK